ncbi:hypothetical protein WJX84_003468 [Apatococcus fuscideae]|uniref:Uncharacterized protein n=1 Tax=Apatococcus fuscideae TaxID=2026836 RepID=A0AAW1T9V4_9CHLO
MEEAAPAVEASMPSVSEDPVATPASPEVKYGSRLNKKVRVTEPRSITAVTHKVCNKCKQNLPAEAYCRQSNTSDGLNLWCKRCRSDRIKQWKKETWQKNAAARKEPDLEKQCAHCLETLPANAFFRDYSHRTGLEHFCKVCKKAIKTERLRVQREAVLLGLPIPRKRKAQAEQVFPEPVPLPPPGEGPMEPSCKLTSRKPTPKKVPTHTRRPYKKRKQVMMLQPGDEAAAGMYPEAQASSSNMPTATLDVNSLPPEFLQAYMQTVQQEGAGPSTSQEPGSAQHATWKTSINPFTGQPYTYMPTA